MRALAVPCCAVIALGVAGCSTMKVNSEYDPEASFRGLESYAWAPRREDAVRRVAPVVRRQLERSVDRELQAKGYRRVASDPDFLVDYVLVAEDRIGETAEVTDERLGWVSVTSRKYVERSGTLVLELSDPNSGRMVWRGWASDVVRDPDVDVTVKKIDEAVRKMIARFPPQDRG